MSEEPKTLLICTVGGRPEPVVTTLRYWKPIRVVFIPSADTADVAEKARLAVGEELALDEGRCDSFVLYDAEDFGRCLEQLRGLRQSTFDWKRRGSNFRVVVDFTAGTKIMTGALTLEASRWPCEFSYVGGRKRTREGTGDVISGSEEVFLTVNPYEALGYHAAEDFVTLFDQRAFGAAARVAEEMKAKVEDAAKKREFSTLEQLARAFVAWEGFDHKRALSGLKSVEKSRNDLRVILGPKAADSLSRALGPCVEHLATLSEAEGPGRAHVLDLLANAERREEEGRLEDAVARLYRAIEALAQLALAERHDIERTDRVPIASVPERLRGELEPRAVDGCVRLGLQESYHLLAALEDPVGERFFERGLHTKTSPLSARNRSILAHGFGSVSLKDVNSLRQAAIALAEIEAGELLQVPKINVDGAEVR